MNQLQTTLANNDIDVATFQVMHEAGPDTLFMLTCPGSDAIALWQRLRALVGTTGYWPVVIGDKEDLDMHIDEISSVFGMSRHGRVPQMIAVGLSLDPQGWLQNQRDEGDVEYEQEIMQSPEEGDEDVKDEFEEARFQIPYDLNGKPLSVVHIGLIPTRNSWETPGYLRFGDWNACPAPAEHVCMLKYWHDLYGAEVVGISHDVIEMQAGRPPRDLDSAWTLAEEQFRYAEDIVSQGVGTVWELALELKNNPIWFFWWD